MAKRKSHKRRRGLRGLRGLRGIGSLKTEMGRSVISPVVAGVLTAGTALGIRAFVKPTAGATSETLYKYAPLIGTGVGLLGAVGLYYMGGGKSAATSAAVSSLLLGGALYGSERVLAAGGMSAIAASGLLSSSVTAPAPAATAGLRQLGAVVPEYARMDGIVMEKVNGLNGLGYNQQNFGENVSLSGTVNQAAFGTAPFGGN